MTMTFSGFYQLRDIRKVYRVGEIDVEALSGVDLDLQSGEFVALQGPSGSGKSTLLNVFGLIEQRTSGGLVFGGKELGDYSDRQLTDYREQHIGFIFQNFNLIPVLTALENVEYPMYLRKNLTFSQIRSAALRSLEDVGLKDFIHHKPAELSGGQRQRVAIARALVKSPQLIIADEPTANLDSKSATQVLDLICELQKKQKTSVIVATHDTFTASRAQRIVAIKDGRIVQ